MDEIGLDWMGLDGVGWDWMGLNGIGWEWMGWDWMGLDGMVIIGRKYSKSTFGANNSNHDQ